jgi:hypothetical protein
MAHLGDFDTSTVIYGKFTTYQPSTGAAFTLGGTPALSVYKDNSTTQSTSGVTLTASFDSVTGLNHFAIDTSADGTFYAAGSFFDIVITTGTVDSVSVVGAVVGSFTLRKDSSLKPTTAGRTLDVSATGEAGVDWANVGSPTTTLNLSGTTIKTATDVETDTADIQTRLPAALVSGRIDASVGAVAANAITAAAIATDAIDSDAIAASAVTEIQAGLATQASVDTVDTVVDAIKVKTDFLPSATAGSAGGVFIAGSNAATSITTALTANITGNLSGSVGSVASGGITAASIADDAIDAGALAADAGTEIADAILARDLGSGTGAGTENERTVRSALRALRNKWSISGATLTVTKEDDVNSAWTSTLTTAESTSVVTQSDPTGP